MTTELEDPVFLRLEPPGPWVTDGSCYQAPNPDLWFPDVGAQGQQDAAKAKEICAGCPVRFDCLNWALDTAQEYGIWGGMTRRERRAHAGARP